MRVIGRSMARAARDFFNDFDVLAPEISKFLLTPGVEGGGWLRATAIVGTIVACGLLLQLLEQHVPLIRQSLAATARGLPAS